MTYPKSHARSTDPDTSHQAAANQSPEKIEGKMRYIASLVEKYPGNTIPDYVDTIMAETGEGSWIYGAYSTVFHHACEWGYIKKGAKKLCAETNEQRYTYWPVSTEVKVAAMRSYTDAEIAKEAIKEAKYAARAKAAELKKAARAAAKAEVKKNLAQEKQRKASAKMAQQQILRGLQIEHTRALAMRNWTKVAELTDAISKLENQQ